MWISDIRVPHLGQDGAAMTFGGNSICAAIFSSRATVARLHLHIAIPRHRLLLSNDVVRCIHNRDHCGKRLAGDGSRYRSRRFAPDNGTKAT